MKRGVPNELLNILDVWLCACYLCVKWHIARSDMFRIRATYDIRQGSILSPFLFVV